MSKIDTLVRDLRDENAYLRTQLVAARSDAEHWQKSTTRSTSCTRITHEKEKLSNKFDVEVAKFLTQMTAALERARGLY